MSIETQLEREEELLAEELNEGKITLQEYNKLMTELLREARAAYADDNQPKQEGGGE